MKVIDDFPNYAVDECGNVFNIKSGRTKAQQTYHGYKYVQLHKDGKTRMIQVHRLVAMAYIPNPEKLPCVNHKDEDKLNNNVGNLEWCTHLYNVTYGKHKPLETMIESRKKPVNQYSKNGEFIATYESATEAQRKTGVQQQNISMCCLKRYGSKSAGGFIWEYATSIK